MNLLASLNDTAANLVHPDVRGRPVEFAAHKSFLSTRLGLSFAALAVAPLCWALGVVPAAWQAAVLAWLAVPGAAAWHVSRSGKLGCGEILSLAAWIGLAVTVTLGTGSPVGLVFLLMVPLEGAASASAAPVSAALAAAAMSAVLLSPRIRLDQAIEPSAVGVAALLGALTYGGLLSIAAVRIAALRRRLDATYGHRYRALVETIDQMVLQFDRAGAVCHMTGLGPQVFGLEPRDLMGRGLFERLLVADRPAFLKLVSDTASGLSRPPVTLRLRTGRTAPSGQGETETPVFAWIELAIRSPVASGTDEEFADSDGRRRAIAAVGLLRDASERVERERAMNDLRTEADRSNAGRDLFLANVTHELRTPLTAIIGFAEMLSNHGMAPSDPAKQREYAGIIHDSGLHLLSVVNSILDVQKLESGSFAIDPEPFDLAALIGTCCDMVDLKAEQAGVALMRKVGLGVDAVVGDRRACKQIVLNLLSNALKFTPRGGDVTIAARPEGTSVLITVADTGIGIAGRDLPRLGEAFFQAKASYDRPNDGTGLGLSVVRGLVGLHGGSIAIESAPGQGTRVTVRLPADCRNRAVDADRVTKIETIARYSSVLRHGEVPSGGRMQKIA